MHRDAAICRWFLNSVQLGTDKQKQVRKLSEAGGGGAGRHGAGRREHKKEAIGKMPGAYAKARLVHVSTSKSEKKKYSKEFYS